MIKEKYITVPINQKGIDEYHKMVFESPNFLSFVLPEEEYEILDRHHVFDIINEKFDKMIDIYESEAIDANQLTLVKKEISLIPGVWMNAVNKAIEYKTCVFLDF